MSECLAPKSLVKCNCTYVTCDKRGNCCKCVSFHNDRGEFPACFFSATAERTYDRSFACLVRDRGLL
jgi:hypothetical protein